MILKDWLDTQAKARPDLAAALLALAETGKALSRRIARGVLGGEIGGTAGENAGGDTQKALDVIADDAFLAALRATPVKFYASEEQDEAVALNASGTLALAIDPLDGSSNIDVNVSIGTIFSVFDARDTAAESFLRPGEEQIAGGYIVYGPQTAFVVTLGAGVASFILDPESGEYAFAGAPAIPETSKEYAINASNHRHWPKPVRAYIEDCNLGTEGPHGRDMNMRWVASLVAETHRILMRGGVFLYPGDQRKGYERGRLRMVYECAPIAFLIEQAGGMATDGTDRLLGHSPDRLHARTPFVFGSRDSVMRVAAYHDLPDHEVSPLFSERGLFNK